MRKAIMSKNNGTVWSDCFTWAAFPTIPTDSHAKGLINL